MSHPVLASGRVAVVTGAASGMDFSSSPTWTGLVREFSNAREIHFAERTHFLPMEIPDQIAELILAEAIEGTPS